MEPYGIRTYLFLVIVSMLIDSQLLQSGSINFQA